MTDTNSPQVAYGRLLESAYFSSYGFERLCDGLEWLLKDDRWRQLGDWDINEFLGTIDLSSLNLGSKRPKLIKRIKELQPDASQRAIAKAVGVAQMTVNRDLRESNDSGNAAKLLKGKDQKSESESYDSWLAQPASETADNLKQGIEREKKRQERAAAREKKGEAKAPPLPNGTFRVIYADPPWRYEHVKTESRAIENQYPTMSLEEIKDLKVPAADNSVLLLWATSPKLAEAMDVIRAWGFEYRTCAVWDKETIGMGYYFRQQHELLLVATKGDPGVPPESDRVASIFRSSAFRSRRADHSEKPKEVYELIDRMYPNGPRIELFARQRHEGWAAWGNEAAATTPKEAA